MQKLKLDLETLAVDGFVTAPKQEADAAYLATLRCTTLCTEIGSCGQICP